MKTLVLMAPMQIKPQLSIGNIYDLVLCDFYVKFLKLYRNGAIFPLLVNVNGSPIEKIAPS